MFESFKNRLKNKIEKNAVKSNLNWTDGEGEHSEEVLLKRSKTPLIGDWGRIYPPVNEDGSWNLMNLIFGGRRNFIRLVIIFGMLSLIYFWVLSIVGAGAEYLDGSKYIILEKPVFERYCSTILIQETIENITLTENLNLSIFLDPES